MKTYFETRTTFNDKGKVTATVTEIEASGKPENTRAETHWADIYYDYFDTLKEAKEWAKQALLA